MSHSSHARSAIQRLESNIWKYAVLLIANKRVFVAILGAYYLTIPGVDAEGIGIILLAGSVAGFFFEIPSGYLSDQIGHKHALVFGRACAVVSTALFLLASNIWWLIVAGVMLSIATAFHSGTGDAFLYETLRGLKREGEYAQIIGRLKSLGFAVPIVFMVTVPFLVAVSFALPFWTALVMDLVGLAAAASLIVPPVQQKQIEEVGPTNFRAVLRDGYRKGFFRFAVLAGLISGILFGVGGFRAPYQLVLGVPVIWYGVFHGIGRAFASFLLLHTGRLKEWMDMKTFFGMQLALFGALILALGATTIPWVIVPLFFIINGFQWGLSGLTTSYLVEIIRESRFKATLLSTYSQIDTMTAGIASFGLGMLIQRTSYQIGFLWLGMALVALALPLYIYILRTADTN